MIQPLKRSPPYFIMAGELTLMKTLVMNNGTVDKPTMKQLCAYPKFLTKDITSF